MGDAQSCLSCDGANRSGAKEALQNRVPLSEVNVNKHTGAPSVASSVGTARSDGMCKVGIGAYFMKKEENPKILKVKSVLRGSPSDAAGVIAVGDTIDEVDGASAYGSSLAELADMLLGHQG
eukprot:CAMPEP_0174941412 /NCGR_PEP_ID=MMETSP1355-20121228/71620_1 /TAXON_ID=464990 /ORGANISM="Hemiselmis tepida, Strain CCMP443" /LENGTH=121 /DNA_ID=CAMNT_0016188519 /DNA_START=114 /DNA_END=475 /DNA_ORIENTATION=-